MSMAMELPNPTYGYTMLNCFCKGVQVILDIKRVRCEMILDLRSPVLLLYSFHVFY